MRRKHGSANVEEHPKGSGMFRVRARVGKRLATIASRLPEKTAHATADAYSTMRAEGILKDGVTLSQFGVGFLDRRERRKIRAVKHDRNRWKTYVDEDAIGLIALRMLRRSDVVEWRDRLEAKGLAVQTVRNALNLLRVALAEALDRELVDENVARDVRVARQVEARAEEDLGGVLTVEEQEALLAAIPMPARLMAIVALFTGLRWAELSWLRREDIQGGELLVRRSTGGGPTKSGKPRRVPLLGPAAEALATQLEGLPASCPWVFPSRDGKPRQNRPSAWGSWVLASGIGRTVRWHDLRHTCATALLAGWWGGERWTIDEVCQMLGHAEISTTERYARKVDETLQNAAKKKFPGGSGSGGSGRIPSLGNAFLNRRSQVRLLPGAPNENAQLDDSIVAALGTTRELPRALQSAIEQTTDKSPEGLGVRLLAKAYSTALSGAEPECASELLAAADAFLGGVP